MRQDQLIQSLKDFFSTHPGTDSVTVSRDGFLFFKPEDAALHTAGMEADAAPKYVTVTKAQFQKELAKWELFAGSGTTEKDNSGNSEQSDLPGSHTETEKPGTDVSEMNAGSGSQSENVSEGTSAPEGSQTAIAEAEGQVAKPSKNKKTSNK